PATSETVDVRPEVLRVGKNAVHAEARTVEGDQILCVVTAVFGNRRASRIDVMPEQAPVHAESPVVFDHVPGRTPNFKQHFTMRWLVGDPPFAKNPRRNAVIEISLDDPAKTTDEHVLAIADSIPPVALSMLDSPVPGSSMTWTLEMLRDRVDDLSLQ